jgi:hypothetical protein
MGKTIVVAVVALMALAGCGWRKQHLTSSHGLSYDSAFAAQRERRPDKAPAVAASGLDAQESAIISDTYRKGLAGKQGTARQEPLILLSPPQPERSNMPPPSVPKE